MNRDIKKTNNNSPEARAHFLEVSAGVLRAIGRSRIHGAVQETKPASAEGDKDSPPVPPDIALTFPRADIIRGATDAMGFAKRHGNEKLHETQRPADAAAARLFDALEQARCDMLGGRQYIGSLGNVAAYLKHEKARCEQQKRGGIDGLQAAILRLMALRAEGARLDRQTVDDLQSWLSQNGNRITPDDFTVLRDSAASQLAYAAHARALLDKLGYITEPPPPTESKQSDDDDDKDKSKSKDGGQKGDKGQSKKESSGAPTPADEDPGMEDDSDGESPEGDDDEDGFECDGASSDKTARRQETAPPLPGEKPAYKVYTREFDQVIAADKLIGNDRLEQHHRTLHNFIKGQDAGIARLAQKLQRRLMGQQRRDWEFNQEEGHLDAARLAGIIIDPMQSLSFKRESERAFKDTVVTLLLDNSGSMRGRLILMTAIAATILARALERCGIKCEILGFTTPAWKGGRAREKWLDAGRPPDPGRLNAVRHIIYKGADEPMRRARKKLAVMMEENILKENIDGEALQWAAMRLEQRNEDRKILMVLSDGAPVDDSTNDANGANYLPGHLKDVIGTIEKRKKIELIGLGIGHDTSAYYSRSKPLLNADAIAETLIRELEHLLDATDASGNRRAPRKAPGRPRPPSLW